MAAPKQSHQTLRTTLTILTILLATIPLTIYIIIASLILLPYTLYNYSSNFGIQHKDKTIVQKYLDIFQSLHPRLSSHLTRIFQSPE